MSKAAKRRLQRAEKTLRDFFNEVMECGEEGLEDLGIFFELEQQ
jgi:hypothetical protein